jgi:hypothetical protein
VAHAGFTHAMKLAAEQSSHAASGPVDSGKQIRVDFADRNPSEWP